MKKKKILGDCREGKCNGRLDFSNPLSLPTHLGGNETAFACAKCGRIHWKNGTLIFSKFAYRVFLKDGQVILVSALGRIIPIPNKQNPSAV